MPVAAVPVLTAWDNYYVIVGTAAASLTGLMFIVITLIASRGTRRSGEPIAAFGTPTVLHFCAALLVSAMFSVPWQALWQLDLLLGIFGLAGVIYLVIVYRRMRRQASYQGNYQPVGEDWAWHIILPFLSYLIFFSAALLLLSVSGVALFGAAAAALLLIFIGIHNAWDTVTFLVFSEGQQDTHADDKQSDDTRSDDKLKGD